MKKSIPFLLLLLIYFNPAMAVRECVYDPRGFTFHCSNNMPGEQIMPGETGNITIICCFTERSFVDSNKTLPITAEIKYNWTLNVQKPDGSWYVQETEYPASQWITNISFPNESRGFESFPVVIEYSLPEKSPLYKPGEVLQSRVDIKVLMEGGVVPNNAVYPQIRIPSSWKGGALDYVSGIVAGSVVGLTLLMLFQYKKRK